MSSGKWRVQGSLREVRGLKSGRQAKRTFCLIQVTATKTCTGKLYGAVKQILLDILLPHSLWCWHINHLSHETYGQIIAVLLLFILAGQSESAMAVPNLFNCIQESRWAYWWHFQTNSSKYQELGNIYILIKKISGWGLKWNNLNGFMGENTIKWEDTQNYLFKFQWVKALY